MIIVRVQNISRNYRQKKMCVLLLCYRHQLIQFVNYAIVFDDAEKKAESFRVELSRKLFIRLKAQDNLHLEYFFFLFVLHHWQMPNHQKKKKNVGNQSGV